MVDSTPDWRAAQTAAQKAKYAAQYEEAAELYKQLGTVTAVAEALGVNRKTAYRRLANARQQGAFVDPAMQAAMDMVGAKAEARLAWVKTKLAKGQTGTEVSVLVTRSPEIEEPPEDVAERISEIMSHLPRAVIPAPPAPPPTDDPRFGLIPANDIHSGALAWGRETGSGDWDVNIAVERIVKWSSALLHALPKDLDEVILLYNGDTLHANDESAKTPRSGHVLDVDGRLFRTVDLTTLALVTVTDIAAAMFPRARVVIKPGNHDPNSYVSLLMGLKWRYYDTDHVIVDTSPSGFWAYRRGKTLLFSHHGHTAKPEQLVLALADQHPEEWGLTRNRYVWTGDKHHRGAKRIGGAMWEQASCMTERDAYTATGGWTNHPELQAIVYSEQRGEVQRHRVAA
jgi:hypothetical protein